MAILYVLTGVRTRANNLRKATQKVRSCPSNWVLEILIPDLLVMWKDNHISAYDILVPFSVMCN